LDDVTEFNGPTMFVPGNHKLGMIPSDKNFDHIPEYGNPQKVRWADHTTMRLLTASSASTASSPQRARRFRRLLPQLQPARLGPKHVALEPHVSIF
jgi:hypothetical protein